MDDPLSPAQFNPSWSPKRSTINPLPPAPPSASSSSTFIRDPRIYGDPGTSLVSPPPDVMSSRDAQPRRPGTAPEAPSPFLRVRIGTVERNRKDLLIRYDASTNLPNFRTTLYRNMQRSYAEFQRFSEQAQLCCPQTIIPALPLPHTSAGTDEEDDRLVRIALQRWFSRVCDDPVLQKEDELRSFIESDFGYQPVPPPSARRSQSATAAVPQVFTAALSKVVRRGPLDEDDELQTAKVALEKLEDRWAGAATAVGGLAKARRALATATADVGSKLISLATVESDANLGTAERKIGRVYEQLSGMTGAQIASDNVVLSDALGYQALNAHAAKDSLSQRTQILEDSQSATKAAINRRRNVERLKGSSSINPVKVDDAIAEMDEAEALDSQLSSRLAAISANLHKALRVHSRNAHEDVTVSLLEHARMSIIFNRQILRELEALKPDLARIGSAISVGSSSAPTQRELPSQATMSPSRPYLPPQQSPQIMTPPPPVPPPSQFHQAPPMMTSQSMFLPPPSTQEIIRPHSAEPSQLATHAAVDPLGGAAVGGNIMAQSMMLPGQRGTAQTVGRAQARRLDERKAAKLLAGGF